MSNFFLKRTFTNFVEMVEALHHWNIEVRQLKKSTINDTLIQLKVENFLLGYAEFSGLTHQIGDIPPGRTFAFYTGEGSKLLWRKKDVPLNALMIFPLNSKLNVITKGIKTTPHTISLPEEELISRFNEEELELYNTIISTNEMMMMGPSEMQKLHEVFYKYTQGAEEDPEVINKKNFHVCLKEELIPILIEILFNKESCHDSKVKDQTKLLWDRIEMYIETHKHRPIMLSELSKVANIGERSLYNLFNDRYHLSPKSYLNTVRLNGVNNDLIMKSSSATTITDIANNWGYWHMGQFAADYKRLFGELPSVTLGLSSKNYKK